MYFFGLSFPQFACVGDGIMGFSNDIELEKIEKCRRPMQTKLSLTLLYSHSCVCSLNLFMFSISPLLFLQHDQKQNRNLVLSNC